MRKKNVFYNLFLYFLFLIFPYIHIFIVMLDAVYCDSYH